MDCAWWGNVGAGVVLSAALGGCSFDSTGSEGGGQLGGTESEGSGTTTGPTSTMSGDSSMPTTVDPSAPTGTTSPTDPSTTDPTDTSGSGDPPAGVASLQLSDGADFGLVAVDASSTFQFTLTNVGDATATALTPIVMPVPFALGPTDCGATLDPDASCTIDIVFAPESIGPHTGSLAIAYHDGEADQGTARDLVGGGQGETRNLIENAGGEDCSDMNAPPDGWVEQVGTNWTCIDTFGMDNPTQGARMFFPAANDTGSFPDLMQAIDVPAGIAPIVGDGDVGMRFGGWSISAGAVNDDPRRFRLEFLDDLGATVDEWDSGWLGSATWEPVEEVRVPHTSTSRIVVHLECEVITPSNCSALFDELALHFFYPPS